MTPDVRPGRRLAAVTWIAPVQGRGLSLTARSSGDEIVLETEEREPLWIRWVSSEITPEACVWRGSASDNGGRTWLLLQEMRMRRRTAG